ncbi:unnamed protein product [Alopecurus aequalis]
MEEIAKMVGSAVVQEVVSGAIEFVRSNHEELASQDHLMERLKMAHLGLKLSLERSKNMPITDVALLQTRMELRLAFQKCRDVLNKHTVLRVQPLSPSLPRRIIRALKPFFSTEKDCISRPCIRKFEWYAEKADKFVRDVESGWSLTCYRFSCPLITHLLEGKHLHCGMVNGSRTSELLIFPCFLEDYGAVANVSFEFKDVETPMKCFFLRLMLRLSESTDIVGLSTKGLQSLGPKFKAVADVAWGELAQISTQVGVFRPKPADQEDLFNLVTKYSRKYRQEPLCCMGDGVQPSYKLTDMFSEQVSYFGFECFISVTEYGFNDAIAKACPIIQPSVFFYPHLSVVCGPEEKLDPSKMVDTVFMQAIFYFLLEPEKTEYTMSTGSAHGVARLTVKKPTTEMGRAPKVGSGSKTGRISKRKR